MFVQLLGVLKMKTIRVFGSDYTRSFAVGRYLEESIKVRELVDEYALIEPVGADACRRELDNLEWLVGLTKCPVEVIEEAYGVMRRIGFSVGLEVLREVSPNTCRAAYPV